MASSLLGSFPIAPSITTSSYASRASWNRIGKVPKEYYILKSPENNLKRHHLKSIEVIGSKHDKYERKYLMNASSAESHESYELHTHQVSKVGILDTMKDAWDVLLKFSRPYVLTATLVGVISTSLLAVETLSDLSPAFFIGVFQFYAAFFFMSAYHIGLNEIVDVEIDKINKPHFALASGKYSSGIAVFVTALSLLMSLGIGWIAGSKPMLWCILVTTVLGTAYSANLPLMRWKKFAPLSLLYMTANSMIWTYLASFLHIQTHVLKRAANLPRPMILTLAMMGVYCVVIGLAKDIPDIEGDKAGGIHTYALQFGAKKVFWFCISLLEIAYGVVIMVGLKSPFLWSKTITVLSHAIMALALWNKAKSVDLNNRVSMQSFYMLVFKLLYIETAVIALCR